MWSGHSTATCFPHASQMRTPLRDEKAQQLCRCYLAGTIGQQLLARLLSACVIVMSTTVASRYCLLRSYDSNEERRLLVWCWNEGNPRSCIYTTYSIIFIQGLVMIFFYLRCVLPLWGFIPIAVKKCQPSWYSFRTEPLETRTIAAPTIFVFRVNLFCLLAFGYITEILVLKYRWSYHASCREETCWGCIYVS